jgi:hypothetical protein
VEKLNALWVKVTGTVVDIVVESNRISILPVPKNGCIIWLTEFILGFGKNCLVAAPLKKVGH